MSADSPTLTEAGNLPAPFTSFVGRQGTVDQARRMLGSARLLTRTGSGGVGKTRLAIEAAAACRHTIPDGAWLVDLAPVRDPSTVASVTAAAMGILDLGARPALVQVTERLAGRRAPGADRAGQLRACGRCLCRTRGHVVADGPRPARPDHESADLGHHR